MKKAKYQHWKSAVVVGACDGRRLGHFIGLCGLQVVTYTPETVDELTGNGDVGRLYRELGDVGVEGAIKTERIPLPLLVAGTDLVIVFPFYENRPVVFDPDTGASAYLRTRAGSLAANVIQRRFGSRFVPCDPNRTTYYTRLAAGLRDLAESHPATNFVVLLPGYDPERFGPRQIYHVPFVSDTFDDFDGMTRRGRSEFPSVFNGLGNIRCHELEPDLLRLLDDSRIRCRELFPNFIVDEEGLRRDVAHPSDLTLRYIAACALDPDEPRRPVALWLDDLGDPWIERPPHALATLVAKLNSGEPQRWCNAVEDGIEAGLGQQLERLVSETVMRFFAQSPNDPSLLLLIHAYGHFARHARVARHTDVLRSIHRYLLSKDLEYGAWKDFLAEALEIFVNPQP